MCVLTSPPGDSDALMSEHLSSGAIPVFVHHLPLPLLVPHLYFSAHAATSQKTGDSPTETVKLS